MAGSLRRYAYAQARIRARLARLLTRHQLELLAEYADANALRAELAALGHPERDETVLAGFADVLDMLEGPAREVVARYRDRYEAENLKALLRGVERRAPPAEVLPLLHAVGALAEPETARRVLEAGALVEAVDRLPAQPFGALLQRHVEATRPRPPERVRLEALAEREAWERAWRATDALDRSDRRSARRVLGIRIDALNVMRALRLRAHGLAPEELAANAIRAGRHLGRAEREALAHEPVEEWPARLARTPLAGALSAGEPHRVERALAALVGRAALRELRAAPFSIGLPLAWLVLLELQASDLRRVLEGHRLGRPPEWIASGLAVERSF